MTPFQALYGYPPPQLGLDVVRSPVASAKLWLGDRLKWNEMLRDNLLKAQNRMKQFVDKGRTERSFSIGDSVYLKLQPYRQSSVALRRNLKLSSKYYGPYKIVQKVGSAAYKLELPEDSTIHPVFHVSLLKPSTKGVSPTQDLPLTTENGQVKIAPESILATREVVRKRQKVLQVLVKWLNLTPDDSTWEDASVLRSQFPNFQFNPSQRIIPMKRQAKNVSSCVAAWLTWQKGEAREEIAKLQDDNKALDRLTKSKEAVLLKAERTVQLALAKAPMVDDLQNKNQELMKQIEICQEENKILDKLHHQNVAEVEKLTQTVRELEEAVLAGGAAANAVRDYQRKVQEMNEERKTLDRELARAKVTANRVATVVANEWKDANDKVMPVKQWLEERRFLQSEMQQLRNKLAISERTAKSEAQLKEKYQMRLKVPEETLRSPNSSVRNTPDGRSSSNGLSRRQSLGGAENISKLTSNGFLPKRSPSFQMRSSGSSTVLKHAKGTSKSFDGGSRSLDRSKILLNGTGPNFKMSQSCNGTKDSEPQKSTWKENQDEKPSDVQVTETDDTVPGLLYDLLQKEVVALRKAGHEKDQSLKDKDDAIEMLAKKVETLTKAMEVEAKKMRREVAAMEKEVAAMRVEKEHENRAKRFANPKGPVNSSQLIPGRYAACLMFYEQKPFYIVPNVTA
ncbi:microtubule-associated protein 70-1-like [Coffea eugenioides]|uniref:microtubule-associated protein 70-1-like n=1 Tax=Coffea eugenioides TaxID=49369 RepID=UPI000F615BC8|nr:microtubule-associated protein 70-1-like [Coffea eugenioides]